MKEKDKQLYMDIAERVSQQSYAIRLKVGAVFVSEEGIISIGYNGTPSGWSNICEDRIYMDEESQITGESLFDPIEEKWFNLVSKETVLHAESNLFSKIMRSGVSSKNGSLFLTHSPCIQCAKIIYQSGIKEVFYNREYRSNNGLSFLKEIGIYVEQFKSF